MPSHGDNLADKLLVQTLALLDCASSNDLSQLRALLAERGKTLEALEGEILSPSGQETLARIAQDEEIIAMTLAGRRELAIQRIAQNLKVRSASRIYRSGVPKPSLEGRV